MLMGHVSSSFGTLKLLNKSEVLHTTYVQWSYYRDPCGFTQAQCEILSLVCGHLMHGSGLLISRKVCFLNNTSLPEGSWLSPPFTTWNSQQNISHNIYKTIFKETGDKVEGCRKGDESRGVETW